MFEVFLCHAHQYHLSLVPMVLELRENGRALTDERVSRVIFSRDHPEVVFTCLVLVDEEHRKEKYQVMGARVGVHEAALHSTDGDKG